VRIFHVRINLLKNIFRSGLTAVTFHTPTHRERSVLGYAIHLLNLAVAGLTCDAFSDVALMREVNVIWKLVNTNPLDRLAFDVSLRDLLDIRTVRLHDAVTVHTDVQRRNTCVLRLFCT